MYDFLLFVHVLSAFALMVTVVMYSAFAMGAPASPAMLRIAEALWNAGGGGTLLFGIWLAIDVDGYDVWDGWILGAIVLWAASAETHRRAAVAMHLAPAGGAAVARVPDVEAMRRWHALRAAIVLALLVVMIYKPGA